MKTNQIRQIFSNSKEKEGHPSISSMAEIMQYVNVDICIDEEGMNYYCKIDPLEMSKSEMPDNIIYEMATDGWVLSKDKKFLVNFY